MLFTSFQWEWPFRGFLPKGTGQTGEPTRRGPPQDEGPFLMADLTGFGSASTPSPLPLDPGRPLDVIRGANLQVRAS